MAAAPIRVVVEQGTDWWATGASIAAAFVGAIAVGFAAWAARGASRSASAAEGLVRLETARRHDERESQKVADVTAAYWSQFGTRARWLRVENGGPAAARGVALEFPGGAAPNHMQLDDLPAELHRGQRVDLTFTHMPGTNIPTVLVWLDDRHGEHRLDVPYVFNHHGD